MKMNEEMSRRMEEVNAKLNEEMSRRMEVNALAQQQQHQHPQQQQHQHPHPQQQPQHQQQQQLLLQHQHHQQQQFLLMQQQYQQHQHQHQQTLTRFASNSNIANNDPHPLQPRNPMLHHNHLLQQQHQQHRQQQQQQQQQQKPNMRSGFQAELEMAQQDAWKVCNPDIKRPFSSLEDACERLLPYHVVADYEAEEDDRILDTDTTGHMMSRSQLWEQTILSKVGEINVAFEKQIYTFNNLLRRRTQGDLRSEERLMIEQSILQDEKQKLMDARAEIESREKAGREAAEAKMRMAAIQARAEAQAQAQAQAEVMARAEAAARVEQAARAEAARVEALAKARAEEHTAHEPPMHEQGVNMDEILHNWGNMQREDEAEPSEDFLNDDHDQETGDDRGFQNMEVASGNGMHDDWREVGELDLNMR